MPCRSKSTLRSPAVSWRLRFLVFIFGLTFWVLSPFLASLAWAGILAYVTWPLHQRLSRRLPGRDNLAALLMTLGVAATLLLPLVWVMFTVVGGRGGGVGDLQAARYPGAAAAACRRARLAGRGVVRRAIPACSG